MKKIVVSVLKYGISFGILAYLFYAASRDDSFSDLVHKPKNWGLLALAFLVALSAVCSTIIRWYLLVRALDIPFALRDAFRLGFMGFLFNFLTLGQMGGDLLKAVFLAREKSGRRAEAVATVFVDRVIGLYALFVVATTAFLLFGFSQLNVRDEEQLAAITLVCNVGMVVTIVGAVCFVIMLLPGFTTAPIWDVLIGIPKIGRVFGQLIGALRMYRRRVPLLLVTLVMSFGTHILFAVSVFLTALGLSGAHPPLSTHFVIVPFSALAGALPLPGGMGAFEYTLDFLYRGLTSADVPARQGFVVALAFLVIKLMIATFGVAYYLMGRSQVAELMKEAEEGAPLDEFNEVSSGAGRDLGMSESRSTA
ncbi:MAG: lysylphosphatidylglycerol synthase transmembrane domain-containing protein [Pirellulaceae bacterium]